ncbi:AcrR family transcriptional regulator [Pseudomonas sp. BIGb0450]|jgi:AcrR family transcriptional regulator|uniref:TetR/AcrR family transcriptional regulator n=1 Tax=unclassified Pseudomonas TaxID=196821 RepID=UPI002168BC71|nr:MULTISPECIES: TetR/AcrR family transcriptional regulator [unclassified Pseudomonas]MCS3419049.1 AcrR family transcriptional regulator [Pseudomonas sp. BIGb0558]MCS3438541.1 AcrR family transcriptional regulator [Pseudomonas sp. BIGb0450]
MNNSLRVTTSREGNDRGAFDGHRHTALKLFAQHGFRQISMRDLALHIGLKPGSIYYYIESKEQLLFEFIEEIYDFLNVPGFQTSYALSPVERLQKFIEYHVQIYSSMPLQFQLLQREKVNLTDVYGDALRAHADKYEAYTLTLIDPLIDGQFKSCATKKAGDIVRLLNSVPGCLLGSGFGLEEISRILFDLATQVIQERSSSC